MKELTTYFDEAFKLTKHSEMGYTHMKKLITYITESFKISKETDMKYFHEKISCTVRDGYICVMTAVLCSKLKQAYDTTGTKNIIFCVDYTYYLEPTYFGYHSLYATLKDHCMLQVEGIEQKEESIVNKNLYDKLIKNLDLMVKRNKEHTFFIGMQVAGRKDRNYTEIFYDRKHDAICIKI